MTCAARSFTVGVPDLTIATNLFREVMGLTETWKGTASASLKAAWHLDPSLDVPLIELASGTYPFGRLRIAEFAAAKISVRCDYGPDAPDSPLDSGPKAIDFYVADPITAAMDLIKAEGWEFRSAPRKHQIGYAISEEVLFTGPGDLPILLMVGHRHAPTSLRPGSPDGMFSEIATVSVISADLDASRRFYGEALGMVAVNDAETKDENRELVCTLVDAPPGTRVHFLLFAGKGEPSGKILLIHFHDVERKRLTGRMRPGNLGFSLITIGVDALEPVAERALSAGGRIFTPPMPVERPEGWRRTMLIEGPNDELFEIVENSTCSASESGEA